MKYTLLLLVVYVTLYTRSALTDSEMVWLKDVTTSFQTDKRKFDNLDFPDVLTFHLSHASQVLTLKLEKNHEIDPNAKIYVVRKLNDDQYYLEKTPDLGKEEIAYYQDVENGAFMTLRCVKRSNGECDRVVNGNIRIEERNYDLRPAHTDIRLRDLLDVSDFRGTRYILRDQAKIQKEISVKRKDVERDADILIANESKLEQDLKDLLQRRQNNQIHFPFRNSKQSSSNVASLGNRDKLKQVYYVEMDVLLDSGIWDFYSSIVYKNRHKRNYSLVQRKIREVFSHIINGVNLRYKEIEDPSIEIIVTLRKFFILPMKNYFPHKDSVVQTHQGHNYIDIYKYLEDLTRWTKIYSSDSDNVMLFTRYNLYSSSSAKVCIKGLTYTGMVCHESYKSTVVQVRDYFSTMSTAAHELGHNLGADHDGEKKATACRAKDLFIMSPNEPLFEKDKPYSRNPWIFSNCSVDAFKDVLKNKTCLRNEGAFYNKTEWETFMKQQLGEVYSPDQQCELINGPNSVFCGAVSGDICRFMQCKHPVTKTCIEIYFGAARGTSCGDNMVKDQSTIANMPLCFVFTNLAATAIPRMFGERLTDTVAKVLNKPVEKITVVTQAGLPMVRAGSTDPAVLVQIHSIAVFDAEKNPKYSEQFLEFLKNEFNLLPANRLMLEYVDIPAYMACSGK